MNKAANASAPGYSLPPELNLYIIWRTTQGGEMTQRKSATASLGFEEQTSIATESKPKTPEKLPLDADPEYWFRKAATNILKIEEIQAKCAADVAEFATKRSQEASGEMA